MLIRSSGVVSTVRIEGGERDPITVNALRNSVEDAGVAPGPTEEARRGPWSQARPCAGERNAVIERPGTALTRVLGIGAEIELRPRIRLIGEHLKREVMIAHHELVTSKGIQGALQLLRL